MSVAYPDQDPIESGFGSDPNLLEISLARMLFKLSKFYFLNGVNPLTTKDESYSDLPEIFTTDSSNF